MKSSRIFSIILSTFAALICSLAAYLNLISGNKGMGILMIFFVAMNSFFLGMHITNAMRE